MSTQDQLDPHNKQAESDEVQSQAEAETSKLSRNPVVVYVVTAILIVFGLFIYILTHGTIVPYLGPIGG